MMNKKGIELSINFMVMFILAVLIFSMTLYFLFQWFGEAEDLGKEIDKQTQEQILAALRSGNQLVQIPFAVTEVQRGNRASFGIGVRNIASEREFRIDTQFSGTATNPAGRPIPVDVSYITQNWLGNFATGTEFRLRKGEAQVMPLNIKAAVNSAPGTSTSKGDYIFDVCVFDMSQGTAPCTLSSYQSNPGAFYTGRMYQVTVRVI